MLCRIYIATISARKAPITNFIQGGTGMTRGLWLPIGITIMMLCVLLSGCGGAYVNDGSNQPPAEAQVYSVRVTPGSLTMQPGDSIAMSAFVDASGDISRVVTWTANGGSVNANGVYVAPNTPGTYTIIATSKGDPNVKAAATVTVLAATPPPVLEVIPSAATTQTGLQINFQAASNGVQPHDSTWVVIEPGGGTIDGNGLYIAPATPGTYTIRATCATDHVTSSTATVTVTK